MGRSGRIHHALYVLCREQAGREASPTAAIIDSQSVKGAEKILWGDGLLSVGKLGSGHQDQEAPHGRDTLDAHPWRTLLPRRCSWRWS